MRKLFLIVFFICSAPCFADNSILWFTTAAERIAINREVYLTASNVIKQQVNSKHLAPKTWGVILDIDETILDNSAWDVKKHEDLNYTKTWDEFAATAQSREIPGAAQFTHLVHELGGYVNLVSNRNANLLDATLKNLQTQHIYFDQVLLDETQKGTSFVDKNPRFNAVIKGKQPSRLPAQKVIAWLGDNIQDFPELKQKTISKNPNSAQYNLFGGKLFYVAKSVVWKLAEALRVKQDVQLIVKDNS